MVMTQKEDYVQMLTVLVQTVRLLDTVTELPQMEIILGYQII